MHELNNHRFPVARSGNYELHITAGDCTLFYVNAQKGLPKGMLGMREYDKYVVPMLTAKYLAQCDGKTKHSEISANLGIGIHPMMGQTYGDQVLEALTKQMNILELKDEPTESPMTITGAFDSIAPLHMSVEITDTCNFMCDHCYVSASPAKLGKRNGDETVRLLEKMKRNGIKVLELTGGECTTHPEFLKILDYASKNFHLVGIISNGFLMGSRKNLAKEIAQYDNVMVQISVDGMGEFHDNFRKKKGAFDMAVEAIRKLRAEGVIVRMAMTATDSNLQDLEPLYLLAKELDVNAFSCAPNSDFGRGQELKNCSSMGNDEITKEIVRILKPYTDDPMFDAQKQEILNYQASDQINCGAGWRSFGMNSATGEVRSCLFLAESKKFGSYDDENYEDMFKSKDMQLFKNAPSPRHDLETCKDCKYVTTCNGCFAKAFQVSESEFPECPWRKKYFGDMQLSLDSEVKHKGCG